MQAAAASSEPVNGSASPGSPPDSPMASASSSSADTNDKRIQNNNTSSYTSGGRLKFFKEGKCLLELTHRSSNEGQDSWVPITKKVYWPPPGPVRAESSPSVHSASEAGSDAGGSIPSPWTLTSAPVASAAAPPQQQQQTADQQRRPSRKERGSKPVAFKRQPLFVLHELCFAMKPPPCIVSLRKKVRHLRAKWRAPFSAILVGAFLMRLEAQAVKSRPPKRPLEMDRIKKASRLEATVTKLTSVNKRSRPVINNVQITPWKSKQINKQLIYASAAAPAAGHHVTKVKSELCRVTETCTAATLPPATPSTPSGKNRVKAEKTVSISATSLLNHQQQQQLTSSHNSATPSSLKTLPITPTLARIKQNSIMMGGDLHTSASLISPDMQRVKVEIGHAPFNYRAADMPRLPTSPVPNLDGPHFISPRKRSMLSRDFDNGSPSIKKHRLSTDSRGSSSEGGGAASPASTPPRHHPNGAANGGRVSSFSIDSIMSSCSSGGGGGSGSTLHRPVPLPASPARVNDLRSNERSGGKSPQQQHTPLVVPITPYQSRATPSSNQIDPRLAHLAGVAADPRFGLNPTFSPAMAAVMSSYYSPFAAASMAQLAAHMWAGSAAMAAATPTSTVTTSSSMMANNHPSSPGRTSRQSSGSSPPRSATPSSRPFSPWVPQYRGEPKVATPTSVKQAELQAKITATSSSESAGDLPLNLSLK